MSYLVYINNLGPDYKNEYIFEFIFSDKNENITGNNWDSTPAHGQVSPPNLDLIKRVGILRNSSLKFEFVQNSDVFGMEDAINGVIALAWEVDEIPTNKKLVFSFGENEKTVKDKLYSRDCILEFEKEMIYEID